MKWPSVFFLAATGWPVLGFAQQGPPLDGAAVLRDLDQIEKQNKQALASSRSTALAMIKAAAASGSAAVELYQRAIEATQFDGVRREGTAFQEWKRSQAEFLRERAPQVILQFHLRYLALSLEAAVSENRQPLAVPSLTYAADLARAESTIESPEGEGNRGDDGGRRGRDRPPDTSRETRALRDQLLQRALPQTLFVRWMRLQHLLPAGEEWELSAGNIPGILERNVRGPLRAAKDPKLLDTWDLEMQLTADQVTSNREHDAAEFNTVARPRLQFARAQDMVELGQTNRAVREMLALIKTYPTHPDFSKWAARLRGLVAGGQTPPSPETSPGSDQNTAP